MSTVSHINRAVVALFIIPLIATAPMTAKTEATFTLRFDDFKTAAGTIAGACLVGAGLGLVGACIYGLCCKSDEQVLSEAQDIYQRLSSHYHEVLNIYQSPYHTYDKEHYLKSVIVRTNYHYSYFHQCCHTVHYKFVDFKLNLDDNIDSLSSSYRTVIDRIAKIKNKLHTQYCDYNEKQQLKNIVDELEKIGDKQSRLLNILHQLQSDVEILPEYRAEIREKRLEEKQREFEQEMRRREQELREREDRLYNRR